MPPRPTKSSETSLKCDTRRYARCQGLSRTLRAPVHSKSRRRSKSCNLSPSRILTPTTPVEWRAMVGRRTGRRCHVSRNSRMWTQRSCWRPAHAGGCARRNALELQSCGVVLPWWFCGRFLTLAFALGEGTQLGVREMCCACVAWANQKVRCSCAFRSFGWMHNVCGILARWLDSVVAKSAKTPASSRQSRAGAMRLSLAARIRCGVYGVTRDDCDFAC